MSNFKYTALDKSGKEVKASVEAEDKQSAIEQLKSQGLSPVKVDEEGLFDKDLSFNFGGKKKVKPRDLSVFCRQFVSITGAGVAIVDALDMLGGQTENKTLKAAIEDTKLSVQKGETLFALSRKYYKANSKYIFIVEYNRDVIKDPQISFLMMIVDDSGDNSGMRRKDILDPNMKYIGISSIDINGTFVCYLTLSYE